MDITEHSTYFLCGLFMTNKSYRVDNTLIKHELQKRWELRETTEDTEFEEYFNNWNVTAETFGLE